MKKIIPFILAALTGTLPACSLHEKPMPAVELTTSCTQNPNNSYELYMPQREHDAKNIPLLVIIDSHGDGKLGIKQFKQAADTYHLVLAASNTVKNNFAGYDQAIDMMVRDVQGKYPVGKTIFITGFSGGARMALGYASQHSVNGLIACGALGSPQIVNAIHCPIISISGMDDFNFAETAQYIFQQQAIPANLKIELTDASHAWPDSTMLTNAVGFLRLSVETKDMAKATKSQLQAYEALQTARIDSLKTSDVLKAVLIARNMATTPAFSYDPTFQNIYSSLSTGNAYLVVLKKLDNDLNFEISSRQMYMEAFSNKDLAWWQKAIDDNKRQTDTTTDVMTKDMYKRIKGFWGIMAYSYSRQAAMLHDAQKLAKVVEIYKALEPDNSDMYYFSAFLPYWKGDETATVEALQKARAAGYSDMKQLAQDFPQNISSQIK